MSATHTPAAAAPPTITRPGSTPATRHKLFVNIQVADLQRAIGFFEALGFRFNPHFTDHTATCMLVGEDAYFMLLTPDKFASFTDRPAADPTRTTPAMYALSVESRAAVEAMVAAALAAGGSPAMPPQDHGFMYGESFRDPDGHHWEVFWMDPGAIPG